MPGSWVEGTTRREEVEVWGDKHQESEARPPEGRGKPLTGGGGGGGVGEGLYDNLGIV